MSDTHDSNPTQTSEGELRRRHEQERSRFFLRFAVIEGAVLLIAVVAIYVLELIDPALGIWVLIGLAMVAGTILSVFLVSKVKRDQAELEALDRG